MLASYSGLKIWFNGQSYFILEHEYFMFQFIFALLPSKMLGKGDSTAKILSKNSNHIRKKLLQRLLMKTYLAFWEAFILSVK